MTAGRPVGRQSATRCGLVPVRVVGAPLFCLAGGGQAGLSALHATGTFLFWRPRCDSRSRGSRQPIRTQRHDATIATSIPIPGNVRLTTWPGRGRDFAGAHDGAFNV